MWYLQCDPLKSGTMAWQWVQLQGTALPLALEGNKQTVCHVAFCGCYDTVQYYVIGRLGRLSNIETPSYHCTDKMIWWLSPQWNFLYWSGDIVMLKRVADILLCSNDMQIIMLISNPTVFKGELMQRCVHGYHYMELSFLCIWMFIRQAGCHVASGGSCDIDWCHGIGR